jgi:glycosyltransferase involved in cell wall biosynthesis
VGGTFTPERALVVPSPIAACPSGEGGDAARDIAAVTYAANPRKKGFDRVLAAWRSVRRPGERLVITGIDRQGLRGNRIEVPDEEIHAVGKLAQHDYRALLRRARVFVCAPRREEYGLAQLEALAEGCRLVTTPAPGGYVALPIARALDARFVGEDLGAALRCALDASGDDYPARAAGLVAPFTAAAVDRIVAEQLLPRLLGR